MKMEKNLTVAVDLSVLDKNAVLSSTNAWAIGQYINEAESDVRLAKGKFWKCCKPGTREEICDAFGWKYQTMREYGMFADEIMAMAIISKSNRANTITYAHWRNTKKLHLDKEQRKDCLTKAFKKGWSPKEVTAYAKTLVKKEVDKLMHTVHGKTSPPDATLEEAQDMHRKKNKEKVRAEYKASVKAPLPTTEVTVSEAKEIFGIEPLTKETLVVLFWHYAKQHHPDTANGNSSHMEKLNRCNTKLKSLLGE